MRNALVGSPRPRVRLHNSLACARVRIEILRQLTTEDNPLIHVARGTFVVNLVPLSFEGQPEGSTLGRMSIAKTLSGDVVGTTSGQMLTAMTDVKGSAGYVAIERVEATLDGKTGAFSFQHVGIMNRGAPSLTVTVVPDSGTGELVGLVGEFNIMVADGKHSYEFAYSLP